MNKQPALMYLPWGRLVGCTRKSGLTVISWAMLRLDRSLADSITSSKVKVFGGLAAKKTPNAWAKEGSFKRQQHKHGGVKERWVQTHMKASNACWRSCSWSFRGSSPFHWLRSCCHSGLMRTHHHFLGPPRWMWRLDAHHLASWVTAAQRPTDRNEWAL